MDQNLAGGDVGGKKAPVTPKGADGYESSSTEEEYEQASEEFSADVLEQISQASHEYDKLQVFNQSMCLIYTDENDILQVEKNVVAEFETIALPMVVVGVAGLYRTGKSYLLNIIAQGKGFQTGHSVRSTTKGIWVWCMMHPRQKDTVLVLLDSEGLGDVDKRKMKLK
ncbi:guanylate-binding protein 6-like isoform X3 [Mya arenaria]|uniref:guanylate-binding protein 6-like isoform X3 n=1 Tax=Mya arenaria TaxID=6604 RepID=UPI0022E1A4A5|nr:guanylate-binding protein 6-like isoform X3 [Mya arenaria]XP_052763175.1 guanylate-binding protein 6-like isoform X3 [Mya arenaria]